MYNHLDGWVVGSFGHGHRAPGEDGEARYWAGRWQKGEECGERS